MKPPPVPLRRLALGAPLVATPARTGLTTGLAALAGHAPTPAHAAASEQASRTGLLVVNGSAGTSPDLLARRLAPHLGRGTDVSFVVENLQGAAGMLAVRRLLGRPADGETILMANSGLICNPPPASPGSHEFDPVSDLAPIAILCSVPFFLVAHPGAGIRRLQDLRKLPRDRSVTYAISTVGSAGHIAGEMLFERAGLDRTPVPYSKNAQAIVDVAAGNVSFGIFSWLSVAGAIETGAVIPLAVCSRDRARFAREIPTAHEQGFTDFHLEGWQGLFVAARTPAPAQREIEARVAGSFSGGTMTTTLATAGYGDLFMPAAQARRFVSTEIARYRALMKIHRIV